MSYITYLDKITTLIEVDKCNAAEYNYMEELQQKQAKLTKEEKQTINELYAHYITKDL